MIIRGHTIVITSKTQIKEKELNVKILGYLPRGLFFNAFELGAEICKDTHVGAIKELKAKALYRNLKQERA
jgi:hypothetical protein